MFRRTTLLFSLLLLTAPTFAACAADTDDGYEVPGGNRLEIVGAPSRAIDERAEHEVEVRYTRNDGSPIDGIVDFAIEGSAGGATLSGHASQTNADGIARVVVRAGSQARFNVVAVAPLASPASAEIDVRQMRFGAVEYLATYTGSRVIDTVEAALFTNITCSDLARTVPAPRETQYTRLRNRSQFENVEAGIPLAIYALGIDRRDNVAAEACADVVLEGATTSVEIPLDDVAEIFGGTYRIDETFDVTGGFSPTLDLVLDILGGLSSDPAAYIVDFVAGRDETPGWLRTALSSRVTRDLVASYLRGAIADIHLPGYVTEVVDFGGDVNRAFTGLTFDGQLTFGEPDEFGASLGSHRLTAIRFPLDGATTERPMSAVANEIPITVGPSITVAEHELSVAFGAVVEMILHEVLLPRLPGSPRTTGEFIGGLLDCDGIAASLGGDSSTTTSIANAVCDIGVTLLGGMIEGYITDMWQYDTLHLSGTANLRDSDQDYDRDTLQEGVATARWTGSSGELSFGGTMAGNRMDDTTGRQHRIRERMVDLR